MCVCLYIYIYIYVYIYIHIIICVYARAVFVWLLACLLALAPHQSRIKKLRHAFTRLPNPVCHFCWCYSCAWSSSASAGKVGSMEEVWQDRTTVDRTLARPSRKFAAPVTCKRHTYLFMPTEHVFYQQLCRNLPCVASTCTPQDESVGAARWGLGLFASWPRIMGCQRTPA